MLGIRNNFRQVTNEIMREICNQLNFFDTHQKTNLTCTSYLYASHMRILCMIFKK